MRVRGVHGEIRSIWSTEFVSVKRDHYGRVRIYVRVRVAGRCVALGI